MTGTARPWRRGGAWGLLLTGCTIGNPAFDLGQSGDDGGDGKTSTSDSQGDSATSTSGNGSGEDGQASTGMPPELPRCDSMARLDLELTPDADTFLRIDPDGSCDIDGPMPASALPAPCGDIDFGATERYFIGESTPFVRSAYLARFSLANLPGAPAVIDRAALQFEIEVLGAVASNIIVGVAPRDAVEWMEGPGDGQPAVDGVATGHTFAFPDVEWPMGTPSPTHETLASGSAPPGISRVRVDILPDNLAVDAPTESAGFVVGSMEDSFLVFLSAKGAVDPPRLLLSLCEP